MIFIMDMSLIDKISFLFVIAVGIPHGALDGAIALILGFDSKKGYFIFNFLYLSCVFLVIASWYFFPVISLYAFLGLAIFHFGSCDWLNYDKNTDKLLVVLTHGLVVIVGIMFVQKPETIYIFSSLDAPDILNNEKILNAAMGVTCVIFGMYIFQSISKPYLRLGIIELISVLLIARYVSSLAAFSFYFFVLFIPTSTSNIFLPILINQY